jgi:hypothetical protein
VDALIVMFLDVLDCIRGRRAEDRLLRLGGAAWQPAPSFHFRLALEVVDMTFCHRLLR